MATFSLSNCCHLHGLSTVTSVPTPGLGFLGSNVYKFLGNSRKGNIRLSVRNKHLILSCNLDSKQVAVLETQSGVWEDPDDGSGSDYDDDDDEDEHLVREVEQLLVPEERAILQQNASPDLSKISTEKWKPLQTLALSGQIRLMDKLLGDGLHIDSVDKDGLTALHKAIIGKKEPVISHLLRKGANPHVKDRDGATPLHYAVQVGALQTVKLLIKYEVDANATDNEGWTPLHIAIQSRNKDIAKVLLIYGADKTRKTKDGKTALDMSLCYGRDFKSYDLAKLLKILPVDT